MRKDFADSQTDQPAESSLASISKFVALQRQGFASTEGPEPPSMSLSQPESENANTVTKEAFDPANAMIPVFEFNLRDASTFLKDVPEDILPQNARATLLITPKSTPTIVGKQFTGWLRNIKAAASITEEHGLHHDGHFLRGMEIAQYAFKGELRRGQEFTPKMTRQYRKYDEEWANNILENWKEAQETGRDIITKLALPDPKMQYNLSQFQGKINFEIGKQSGEKITQWQLTSYKGHMRGPTPDNFDSSNATSYPIALVIHAPEPE